MANYVLMQRNGEFTISTEFALKVHCLLQSENKAAIAITCCCFSDEQVLVNWCIKMQWISTVARVVMSKKRKKKKTITCMLLGLCLYLTCYYVTLTANFTPHVIEEKHPPPTPSDDESEDDEKRLKWTWKLVENREIAVYSAYLDYEHDLLLAQQILIMAVINVTEKRPIRCHFLMSAKHAQRIITVEPVGTIQLNPGYNEATNGVGKEILIQCPLKSDHETVTAMASETEREAMKRRRERIPLAVMVSDGSREPMGSETSGWIKVYVEPVKPLGTVWCIGPLYDKYDQVQVLVEQLEWAKLQNFEKIFVYVDEIDSKVDRVLQYYSSENLLQIIPWNLARLVHRTVYYLGQIAIVNDCVYRNKHRAKYVHLYDVDERLVNPKEVQFQKQIEKIFGNPNESSVCALVVQSAFFKRAIMNDNTTLMLFSRERSEFYNHGTRSKVIVKPNCLEMTLVHDIGKIKPNYYRHTISREQLFLAHFRFETIDISYSVDSLLPNYVDLMSPRVAAMMKKFNSLFSLPNVNRLNG